MLGPPAQMGFHLLTSVVSATVVRRASSCWVTSLFHHIKLTIATLVLESHGCPGEGVYSDGLYWGACSDGL